MLFRRRIWQTKSDPRVEHLNTILARGRGNLNDPIFKRSKPGVCAGEVMLKFRFDCRISQTLDFLCDELGDLSIDNERKLIRSVFPYLKRGWPIIFGVFLTVNVVSLWRHVLRSSCALCFRTKNNFLRVVSIWSSRSSQSSQKLFRRSGRSYGNAIQTIANDPEDWDDLDRVDKIEFYPDDLNIFWDGLRSFRYKVLSILVDSIQIEVVSRH